MLDLKIKDIGGIVVKINKSYKNKTKNNSIENNYAKNNNHISEHNLIIHVL